MDKYPFNVFAKYVEGNKASLTGIGVIATISALFLNLDQSIYGESLRNLQLLLLLFLILGIVFLTINSVFWFKENADSLFSGLITFSLGLTGWRIWEFVLDNFRSELNQYLLLINISMIFVVYGFLFNFKKKAETTVSNKISDSLIRAVLYGFIAFLFLYLPNVIMGYYSDFTHGRELALTRFISPPSGSFVWTMSIWIAVTEFCVSFFFTKERARLWLSILLLSVLGIALLAILWPVVLNLICVFKTAC